MASNFKTGNNKIKLLTEYENVTQKSFTAFRIAATKRQTTSAARFS
jgi:hypothetical protein